MKILFSLAFLLLLFSGCATTYQPQGFKGGYSEYQIKSDVWVVRFKGNGYTSPSTCREYLYRRIGELQREQGYSDYQIVNSNHDVGTTAYSSPVTCSGGNGYATCSGGDTHFVNKHTIEATVQFLGHHDAQSSSPQRSVSATLEDGCVQQCIDDANNTSDKHGDPAECVRTCVRPNQPNSGAIR